MRGAGQSRFREVRHHSATEEYLDISLALLARGRNLITEHLRTQPREFTRRKKIEGKPPEVTGHIILIIDTCIHIQWVLSKFGI